MSMDFYNTSYDKFCTLMPLHASILEVGCGPGVITHYLHLKRPDFKILSTDFAPKMIELAKENVPSASFQVLDARKMEAIEIQCHGLVAGFILPFFTKEDVRTFFRNCAQKLINPGVLYFSFVAGKEEDSHTKKGSTGDELYFRYHERNFIEKALQTTGFFRKRRVSNQLSNW